jgi:hypothetical protein
LQADRARFNAGVDQAVAGASGLPADQRDPLLAQLAAVRAQGNAGFDQALADPNCTSVPPTTSTTTTTPVPPTTSTTTSTTLPATTTTTTTTPLTPRCEQLLQARAQFNFQMDRAVASAGDLPPSERAARLAQLAAARAQGNAEFDRALAASGCPAAP